MNINKELKIIEIYNFLQILSQRMYDENDLSDFIWSLCNYNFEFKEYFLSFFFDNISFSKPFILKREYSRNDSRLDFYFEIDDQEYLIEIKINDRKQHFQQYIDTFPNAKRAYITNYNIDKSEKEKYDYRFRTWEEMILDLENNATNNSLKPFAKLIRFICNVKEIKKMNLSNLSSLFYFNNFVNQIVNNPIENFELSQYNNAKDSIANGWSGSYFSLQKKGGKEIIYPWFGIHYHDNVFISLDFEFKPTYCDILRERDITKTNGKYFIEPEKDSSLIRVKLNQKWFEELNNSETVENQKDILKNYFNEVICEFGKYIV